MLRAASSARNLLPESRPRIVEFLRTQLNEDGGGKDRAGKSDLYYTVFVLEGLEALGAPADPARTCAFLRSFGDGSELDFVHTACLARCWAGMPSGKLETNAAENILRHLETWRSADGGYGSIPGAESANLYHCFLAFGAYQDLERALSAPQRLRTSVETLQTADGAYANEANLPLGTTPTTAAATVLLRQLGVEVAPAVGRWLIARCAGPGGFLAAPLAPYPDLLSTATALHALATLGVTLEGIRDACVDFVCSLSTGRAFKGSGLDEVEDAEYTYYALLTLGQFNLASCASTSQL